MGLKLVLGIDSTFTYRDYVGGYTGGNTGTWKPAGKKIILNSYLQHNQDTTEEYYIMLIRYCTSNYLPLQL